MASMDVLQARFAEMNARSPAADRGDGGVGEAVHDVLAGALAPQDGGGAVEEGLAQRARSPATLVEDLDSARHDPAVSAPTSPKEDLDSARNNLTVSAPTTPKDIEAIAEEAAEETVKSVLSRRSSTSSTGKQSPKAAGDGGCPERLRRHVAPLQQAFRNGCCSGLPEPRGPSSPVRAVVALARPARRRSAHFECGEGEGGRGPAALGAEAPTTERRPLRAPVATATRELRPASERGARAHRAAAVGGGRAHWGCAGSNCLQLVGRG
eukprot:CAMPEP_0179028972 /NCGR_PEP_ID=MMETSP0796-20121207/9817_1 /TAXON_ID=73915 /ORGANISM="Pyrodinium bahamense, Strain pbaha01" /LENGTH=266 /DNA_ID=CAMNT_0020725123 /DNA_START=15 /DNA_END=811 /DNA_ORIENTATION=-